MMRPLLFPDRCPCCGCRDYFENMITGARTFVCGLRTEGGPAPTAVCRREMVFWTPYATLYVDEPPAQEGLPVFSIAAAWLLLCALAGLVVGLR